MVSYRSRRSPAESEATAVSGVVEDFRHYIWGRRFSLITDCSVLMRLVKRLHLKPKLYRWALRLMVHEWTRSGVDVGIHLPDALSRLQRFDMPGHDVDASFPDDLSTQLYFRGAKNIF